MMLQFATILAAVSFLTGVVPSDQCFTNTNETWSNVGTISQIISALNRVCSKHGVTNKNYSLYDGKTECVHVNNHSFTYQFSFDDPDTLPPGEHVNFTLSDCMQIGQAIVHRCPHGGNLHMFLAQATLVEVTIRAEPWSGLACTGL